MALSDDRKQYIRDLANGDWVYRMTTSRSDPEYEKEFERQSIVMDEALAGC